ncbi:MAG: HigA family addiction module antitoxin [Candidatus Marinimicrobia bacterium]|jgi:HTH-type transcriptional regulator/antitoxin HigA|nr:HigA family addiction module antitoxin [Candidatus Neomarinimicrobiota bacterium]
MINKQYEFYSNLAIPPGETLLELLEYNNFTQVDLAKRMDISKKHINEIIKGKATISYETSIKLETIFGLKSNFWNNLERKYREILANKKQNDKIKKERTIAKKTPYYELAKLGYVEKLKGNYSKKVINLRRFFGVSSLKLLETVFQSAYELRIQKNKKPNPLSLASFLRIGEIEAKKNNTNYFDINILKEKIPSFRKLTLIDNPEIFIPKLIDLTSSVGSALVITPHLKNTYINGAINWINPHKVILMLTKRGVYTDIFWFSFFHELGHIILHGKKDIIIEYNNKPDKKESEADAFASKTLIKPSLYKKFILTKITKERIVQFSKKISIHPAIIIGRLQHDKIIPFNKFNHLKIKLPYNK